MNTRKTLSPLAAILIIGSAAAAPSDRDLTAYNDTAARLSYLIAEADAAGNPTSLHSTKEMDLFRQLADEHRMLSGPELSANDFSSISNVCGLANRISTSLMLFGAKSRVDPTATPEHAAAALVPLMQENSLQFQQQLLVLQPFQLRCMAKLVPALEKIAADINPEQMTGIRKDGLSHMRSGLLQAFVGAFNVVLDVRYQDANRLALASALADSANSLVKLTQIPVRTQISDSAAQVATNIPEPYKSHLQEISRAFKDQTCGPLCSIQ